MNDYIDRQAVIDLLKEMRKDGNAIPWEGKDVFSALRKLPAADDVRPQWTPTVERLPEKNGKYLCIWQGRSIETGMFLNGHFRLYGEIKDRLVSHWMPLPELPDGTDMREGKQE